MDNHFPVLNLGKFALSYDSFFDATINILENADRNGSLVHILPEKIWTQYRFSEAKRKGYGLMHFLWNTYISRENKDVFLSFLNVVLEQIDNRSKLEQWQLNNIHKHLQVTSVLLIDLAVNANEAEVFDLDFYYDAENVEFRRKLDSITTEIINDNTSKLDNDNPNRARYEECVAEFLSFKQIGHSNKNLFYNQSLDKLKRIVENTLEQYYKKDDGSFPKLSNKKQISNILFGTSHPDFESRVDYILSNIHHEKGGKPKKFTEKEYVYSWLELNQILYLLNRYKSNL